MMISNSGKPYSPAMFIKIAASWLRGAWKLSATVLQIIFAPWRITYDPIAELLQNDNDDAAANTQTPINGTNLSVADSLTASWVERKLSELSWVGITVRDSLPKLMVLRSLHFAFFPVPVRTAR